MSTNNKNGTIKVGNSNGSKSSRSDSAGKYRPLNESAVSNPIPGKGGKGGKGK